MRGVIEKETALNMHEIVLVIVLCGFRKKHPVAPPGSKKWGGGKLTLQLDVVT